MFVEITQQRFALMAQAMPKGPFRLLSYWLNLSKDGQHRIYTTAPCCCAQLGCSESSYHRWRRWLEEKGLVAVRRTKVSREMNLPNLVSVMSLKRLSTWCWSRLKEIVSCHKGVTHDRRTPVPYIREKQIAPNVQKRPWMQSPVYLREVAKGLMKKRPAT